MPDLNLILENLIAVVGIYSLLAYTIMRRTQAIAIRMALGARRTSLIKMVLSQGIKPVLLSLSLGLAGALALGRFLSSMLFSVSPMDGVTYGIVTVIIVVSALSVSHVLFVDRRWVHRTRALRPQKVAA